MISFIDEHRGVFGVEPICRLLPIAPSTYYENVAKRLDVDRLSIRASSDIGLKIEIRRVFEQNFRVYGVRKVWRQLKREGFDVARCTVARLLRSMSLQRIIRGKPIRTTFSDKTAPSPLDRLNLPNTPAEQFQRLMADHGITCSMSRSGNVLATMPQWKASSHHPKRKGQHARSTEPETMQGGRIRLHRTLLQPEASAF